MPQEKVKSFRGVIDKETKVLKLNDRKGMDRFLETLSGEVSITIQEVKSRTHWQNKYYHGPFLDYLMGSGYFEGYPKKGPHSVDQLLKDTFKVEHTSHLTMSEFQEFLNAVTIWAATEFGLSIPPPNDDWDV